MTMRRVHWLPNLALIAICAAMIFPVFATAVISFKRQADVTRKPPLLFPCDTPAADFDLFACRFDAEGYDRLLTNRPDPNALFGRIFADRLIGVFLPNTLLYATSAALLTSLLAGAAGYAFARFEFRGRRALQTTILLLTGMPLLTNLIALYQLLVGARRALAPLLGDGIAAFDRVALIIIYTGLFLPFSIWIIKGFYDAIPRELEEAAQIDGCTPVGALLRVTAPIAAPGLFAAFLLTFVGVWNEFVVNYLIVGTARPELRSAVVGLYSLTGTNLINYQVLAAACVLIMLPVLLVFAAFRGVFFRAMTEGAVK